MSKEDLKALRGRQVLIEEQTLGEMGMYAIGIKHIIDHKINKDLKRVGRISLKKRLKLRESRKTRKFKSFGRRK